MYLLGLDVGTTGVKAVIFDEEGNINGYGFDEYDVIFGDDEKAEQNPEEVWQKTKNVILHALNEKGIKDIKAISLSVQGDAIIPVDKNFDPIHNAILGMDYRSRKQAQYCDETFGGYNLFKLTGMRPHPMNSLTKVLWLKENKTDVFFNTYKFMTYADFVISKLCGCAAIDYTMASRTMAFELEKKEWSEYILGKLDLTKDMFSEAVASATVIGTINSKLADELGINKNALIVSGGHDQVCAGIGAGAIKDGIAVDSHGTAEVLSTAFSEPALSEDMYNGYYPCYLHGKKDMYFTFALNHIGGILFKWFKDNFGYLEITESEKLGKSPYELMIKKLPKTPSDVLVLPHFNGSGTPWCDFNSKGAIVGLKISTSKYDILKGILDSLAYEIKINIEYMQKSRILINKLRCVGGAAKSSEWLQIKADIFNCCVETLKVREAACLGAAILAGTATGVYSSIDEGVSVAVKIKDTFMPNDTLYHKYFQKFIIYKELYNTLKQINIKL